MATARAQISVETLMVFLLFLVLLGIAYTATSKLGFAADRQVNAALSRGSFNDLSNRMEEACILGNGNVRMVSIKGSPASLSQAGEKQLEFRTPYYANTVNSSCALEVALLGPSSAFTIKNIGGKIEIS